MSKKNKHASGKKERKYKKCEIDFKDDIMFQCSKCSYILLSWFDGIEFDISAVKCENCNEVYPLKDLYLKHEEEIKQRFVKDYGYSPVNLKKEFAKSLREAGFTWGKPVFDEKVVIKKDNFFKKLRILLIHRKNFFKINFLRTSI